VQTTQIKEYGSYEKRLIACLSNTTALATPHSYKENFEKEKHAYEEKACIHFPPHIQALYVERRKVVQDAIATFPGTLERTILDNRVEMLRTIVYSFMLEKLPEAVLEQAHQKKTEGFAFLIDPEWGVRLKK
jgi:hypothetical protein